MSSYSSVEDHGVLLTINDFTEENFDIVNIINTITSSAASLLPDQVEVLSRLRTDIPPQASPNVKQFHPDPFLYVLQRQIDSIDILSQKSAIKVTECERRVMLFDNEHQQQVQTFNHTIETITESFHKLEQRVSKIAHTAMSVGHTIDSLSQTKTQTRFTQYIIASFVSLNEGDFSSIESMLSVNDEKQLIETGYFLQLLSSIADELASKARLRPQQLEQFERQLHQLTKQQEFEINQQKALLERQHAAALQQQQQEDEHGDGDLENETSQSRSKTVSTARSFLDSDSDSDPELVSPSGHKKGEGKGKSKKNKSKHRSYDDNSDDDSDDGNDYGSESRSISGSRTKGKQSGKKKSNSKKSKKSSKYKFDDSDDDNEQESDEYVDLSVSKKSTSKKSKKLETSPESSSVSQRNNHASPSTSAHGLPLSNQHQDPIESGLSQLREQHQFQIQKLREMFYVKHQPFYLAIQTIRQLSRSLQAKLLERFRLSVLHKDYPSALKLSTVLYGFRDSSSQSNNNAQDDNYIEIPQDFFTPGASSAATAAQYDYNPTHKKFTPYINDVMISLRIPKKIDRKDLASHRSFDSFASKIMKSIVECLHEQVKALPLLLPNPIQTYEEIVTTIFQRDLVELMSIIMNHPIILQSDLKLLKIQSTMLNYVRIALCDALNLYEVLVQYNEHIIYTVKATNKQQQLSGRGDDFQTGDSWSFAHMMAQNQDQLSLAIPHDLSLGANTRNLQHGIFHGVEEFVSLSSRLPSIEDIDMILSSDLSPSASLLRDAILSTLEAYTTTWFDLETTLLRDKTAEITADLSMSKEDLQQQLLSVGQPHVSHPDGEIDASKTPSQFQKITFAITNVTQKKQIEQTKEQMTMTWLQMVTMDQDTIETLLRALTQSIKRATIISPMHSRAEHINQLFSIVSEYTYTHYLTPLLSQGQTYLPPPYPKSEPKPFILTLIKSCIDVDRRVSSYLSRFIAPHLNQNPNLRVLVHTRFDSTRRNLEEMVQSCLTSYLSSTMNYITHLFSLIRSGVYKIRATDGLSTVQFRPKQEILQICECIENTHANIMACLLGYNIDQFLLLFGQRLYDATIHFLTKCGGVSVLGAGSAVQDIIQLQRAVLSIKLPRLDTLFTNLKVLSHLFFLEPEDISRFLAENTASITVDSDLVLTLISCRADYYTNKTALHAQLPFLKKEA